MILNFVIDFILLLTVSFILKRNVSITRIMLGAFAGGISILFLLLQGISFKTVLGDSVELKTSLRMFLVASAQS